MASACVNNIGVPPENFPYGGWLSPRLSFSNSNSNEDTSGSKSSDPTRNPDPEPDFEFRRLDGPPAAMLPADQLFSDGKLVPLNLPSLNNTTTSTTTNSNKNNPSESASPRASNPRRRLDSSAAGDSVSGGDPYLFSPKAPRCSSRWKELLGLKKLYHSTNGTVSSKTTSSSSSSSKSLKLFLHRGSSKTTWFSSENAPLLMKDHSDCESLSMSSSRLSLSSSSSGHEHEELPRLSLDSEKPNPNPNPISLHRNPNPNHPNHPRIRLVKPRANSFDAKPGSSDPYNTNRVGRSPIRRSESGAGGCSRGASVDSPRMNSSGKIVFQSLERSSSSPSSFNNGGPRFKQRGMERSYSANVRVTPVLNVPVCSLRGGSKSGSVFGFGQLFGSPQKKEGSSVGNNNNGGGGGSKGRNRCDRN